MLKPVPSAAAILRLRRPRVLSAQDIRMSSFDQFGLDPRILSAIERMGYTQPTPIQEKAIPVVLMGGDVMGAAQTGTGKTAGYGLPLIARILPKANTSMSPARHPVRALILAPRANLRIRFPTISLNTVPIRRCAPAWFMGASIFGRRPICSGEA